MANRKPLVLGPLNRVQEIPDGDTLDFNGSIAAPGDSTEIVINSGGVFGTSSAFTYSIPTNTMSINKGGGLGCVLFAGVYGEDGVNATGSVSKTSSKLTTSIVTGYGSAGGENAVVVTHDASSTVCSYEVTLASGTFDRTSFYCDSDGALTWGGYSIWHAGNGGAGSFLDADLLDGQEGAYYLSLSNFTGVLPVASGGTGQTTLATTRNAMGLGNTTGPLPIENGGTGQTTAALARNALGLGNTTGALPIANGGTGATTAALARNNLGLGNTAGALPIANGGTAATTVALARNNLGLGNTAGALPVANGGTGAADASTARTNLGLGTSATRNVPAFGNAAATEVVLGNDTRLSGGAVPGATTQVIYNNAGSLTGSANMTFDGTTFKSAQAQARLRSITQNATVTMSSATFPDQNLIVKKTATASYTYTIDSTLGSDDCTITFVNASTAGNMTIQGSGVTIYRNGTGASTIVLTPRQMVTLVRIASGQWIC